jgi:putative endonuclease
MHRLNRKEAGEAGELAALHFLSGKGLKVLLRNYRCRGGEIDLVMFDDTTLALIEVRLRSDLRFGGAAASVDTRKQKRLVIAARHLLLTKPELTRYRARFDVIALTPQTGQEMKVEWLRDAFRLS